jgi:F0F1-type ATP synthase membrane subunit c/vacuolar-type H+-ATPase subunit K
MFQTQRNSPQTRLIICLALMASVGLYVVFAYFISGSRTLPGEAYKPLQMPIMVASVAIFLLCVWRSLTSLSPLQAPNQFTTNMIVVLALAEAITILGLLLFLMGMPFNLFLPFAIVTVLAQGVLVLPRVLTSR